MDKAKPSQLSTFSDDLRVLLLTLWMLKLPRRDRDSLLFPKLLCMDLCFYYYFYLKTMVYIIFYHTFVPAIPCSNTNPTPDVKFPLSLSHIPIHPQAFFLGRHEIIYISCSQLSDSGIIGEEKASAKENS